MISSLVCNRGVILYIVINKPCAKNLITFGAIRIITLIDLFV